MTIVAKPGYLDFNPKPLSRSLTEEDLANLREIYALILSVGSACPEEFDDWSIYGREFTVSSSFFYTDPEIKNLDMYEQYKHVASLKDAARKCLADLKTVGVNWYKTSVPELRTYSDFVGTGNPCKSSNYWVGVLELKDGRRVKGYADDDCIPSAHTRAKALMDESEDKRIENLVVKTFG